MISTLLTTFRMAQHSAEDATELGGMGKKKTVTSKRLIPKMIMKGGAGRRRLWQRQKHGKLLRRRPPRKHPGEADHLQQRLGGGG